MVETAHLNSIKHMHRRLAQLNLLRALAAP